MKNEDVTNDNERSGNRQKTGDHTRKKENPSNPKEVREPGRDVSQTKGNDTSDTHRKGAGK